VRLKVNKINYLVRSFLMKVRNLVIICAVMLSFSTTVFAQVTVNTDGSATVNGTVQASAGFGYVPVGTILPFYKLGATATTFTLPTGWVACNGQEVALAAGSEGDLLDNVSDGKIVLPNLNLQKGGLFLRGGNTAGVAQDDAFKQHTHIAPYGASYLVYPAYGGNHAEQDQVANPHDYSSVSSETGGSATAKTETRPVNMSVIWIIRVL